MLSVAGHPWVLSAESCPLTTKVTLKVIRYFGWQYISVESYTFPNKKQTKRYGHDMDCVRVPVHVHVHMDPIWTLSVSISVNV
jgi:hypothetical protein